MGDFISHENAEDLGGAIGRFLYEGEVYEVHWNGLFEYEEGLNSGFFYKEAGGFSEGSERVKVLLTYSLVATVITLVSTTN